IALVFYNRALSSSERVDVEDLMASLYGRAGRAYYFSAAGNDTTGDGTQGNPFQTSSKANSLKMTKGDTFFFNGGDTFGQLHLALGSVCARPTLSSPAVVTSYGTGKFNVNAVNGYGIWSDNLSHNHISNAAVSGSGVTLNAGSPNTSSSTSTEPGIKA